MDIRGLAAHLGLSIGTVSRALNDRKDVSPATRTRVVEAAAALGYTPNQSGRTLRSGRTGTIGFVLTLEHDSAVHGDPFFMSLFEGVQLGLAEEGFDLVILLARMSEDGLAFLRRHVSRGIADGWILSATQHHDPRIAHLVDNGVPFVSLGRTGAPIDHSWIDMDFEGVVAEAMALFVDRGHRRIGLIAPPATINNSHIIVASYRATLERRLVPFDPALVHLGEVDENAGAAAVAALMRLTDAPTALLVMGETAPVGTYRQLRAMSLEPGRDVGVIGLRSNPASDVLTPPLTCFSLSLDAMGRTLAAIITDLLKADEATDAPATQIRWPMRLVTGSSHDVAAGIIPTPVQAGPTSIPAGSQPRRGVRGG